LDAKIAAANRAPRPVGAFCRCPFSGSNRRGFQPKNRYRNGVKIQHLQASFVQIMHDAQVMLDAARKQEI
jgi:hypothetical protein